MFGTPKDHNYPGMYLGNVTHNEDPKLLGRVRVAVPLIATDPETGYTPSTNWAIPLGVGGFDSSNISIPKVGDLVAVCFEQGDYEKPFWFSGPPSNYPVGNDLVTSQPKHTQNKYDEADITTRGGKVPPTKHSAKYKDVQQIKTPAGYIEFNKKEDEPIITIHHKSGSRIQFQPDGSIHVINEGNEISSTKGSKTEQIEGKLDKEIVGPTKELYKSGRNITDSGIVTYVNESTLKAELKKFELTMKSKGSNFNNGRLNIGLGTLNIDSVSTKLSSGGGFNIAAGGELNIISTENIIQSAFGLSSRKVLTSGPFSYDFDPIPTNPTAVAIQTALTALMPTISEPTPSIALAVNSAPGGFVPTTGALLRLGITGVDISNFISGLPPQPLVNSTFLVGFSALMQVLSTFVASVGASNPATTAQATAFVSGVQTLLGASALHLSTSLRSS